MASGEQQSFLAVQLRACCSWALSEQAAGVYLGKKCTF